MGAPEESNCFFSLDGIDCRINEPSPFDARWWSHKFNSAGLRYEVGISIYSGHIIWVNGSVPCGEWDDLSLARSSIIGYLDEHEMIMADSGYRDRGFFLNQNDSDLHFLVMARHETINSRIKPYKALDSRFRHDLNKHDHCFRAVVNLIQIGILTGDELFEIAF